MDYGGKMPICWFFEKNNAVIFYNAYIRKTI